MKFFTNHRGDTLIEVTIALAILTSALFGAYVVANKLLSVSLTANERNQVVGAAEQQLEALESFRDSHTWAEFNGGGSDAGGPFIGINTAMSVDCDAATAGFQPLFTMVKHGNNLWYPTICGNGCTVNVQSSSGCHIVESDIKPSAERFHIYYQVDRLNDLSSGLHQVGEIDLVLSDLGGVLQP